MKSFVVLQLRLVSALVLICSVSRAETMFPEMQLRPEKPAYETLKSYFHIQTSSDEAKFKLVAQSLADDPDTFNSDGSLQDWILPFVWDLRTYEPLVPGLIDDISRLSGKERITEYGETTAMSGNNKEAFNNIARFRDDTSKPNAVFILPSVDYNGAFVEDNKTKLYEELTRSYDVLLITVRDQNELCSALLSVPNIELAVISGHGSPSSLQLGESSRGKRSYLDVQDTKLARCFQNLLPNSTIFLNSCATGGDRKSGKNNLAAVISEMTGRRVIASRIPVNEVKMISPFPFEVQTTMDNDDGSTIDGTLIIPAKAH